MSIPAQMLTTTCDVYRPFGDTTPTTSDIPCRLTPALSAGTDKKDDTAISWTHTLDISPEVDIRDGCSRTPGQNAVDYADGDEVRVPAGSGTTRYVVVWVETVGRGTPMQYQRAYLLRHEAVFPDP